MGNDDSEQQLVAKIELAAREFQSVADELRTIATNLPRKARPYGDHLEAIATRLDGIAGLLGTEVMLRPDPEFADGLLKSGKRALKWLGVGGMVVAGLIGTGAGEQVGAELTDRIASVVLPAESAATDAELAIQTVLAEPNRPDDAPERIVTEWSEPVTVTSPGGFSGTQTAKIAGISYRQLDYWARTDLIRPSLSDSTASGSRRMYSYDDLLEIKTIKKLMDSGIKLEQVRRVFDFLRRNGDIDYTDTHIVIDGGSVTFVNGRQLVDILATSAGGVLNVLSLDGVRNELNADLNLADE